MKELEGWKFPDSLSAILTDLFTEAIKCYNGPVSAHNMLTGGWAQFYWFSSYFWWIRFSSVTNTDRDVFSESWEACRGLKPRTMTLPSNSKQPCPQHTCQGWLPGVGNCISSWGRCVLIFSLLGLAQRWVPCCSCLYSFLWKNSGSSILLGTWG